MKNEKISKRVKKIYGCYGVIVNVILILTMVHQQGIQYIFKLIPKPGTKVKEIFDRAKDIKACLQYDIFEPFIENGQILLSVARHSYNENRLLPILKSSVFNQCKMKIPIALGYDMLCRPFLVDLASTAHFLYGGTTGMGKTVGLQCLLLSVIWKNPAQNVNIIIIDVIANDLDVFEGIPHLSHPIVKDEIVAYKVIKALYNECERRRNLSEDELEGCSEIILVIDEAISLFQNIDKSLAEPLRKFINNLLRHGRHARIHVLFGTQDPSKANLNIASNNFTANVAFGCRTHQDSQVIIGQSGAEKLDRKGAMLYVASDQSIPKRIQGAYVTKEEIERVIHEIKNAHHDLSNKFIIPEIDVSEMQPDNVYELALADIVADDSNNQELSQIILWTLSQDTISAKKLIDKFRMGNRAYNIMETLYGMGIVSEQFAKQPRKVIPTCVDDISSKAMELLAKYGYTEEKVTEVISERIKRRTTANGCSDKT